MDGFAPSFQPVDEASRYPKSGRCRQTVANDQMDVRPSTSEKVMVAAVNDLNSDVFIAHGSFEDFRVVRQMQDSIWP